MTLDNKTIQELEKKLLERSKKLKKDLDLIADPIDEKGDYRTKFEDIGNHQDENAKEVEEFVDNIAIKESLEEQLKNVEIALGKIKEGKYGVCEECGGEIRKERLLVNPSAKRCMKCAK